MTKDALGLEWNKKNNKDSGKDPDDQLYTAMIWALSIGIVVVIVTLFITRPAPESFTELYFNNHTTLPEYITLNTSYSYSFTLHNLENKNTTYNYTISTEYFDLDYTCEKPEIYLEQENSSRITQTNDPALYIKEQEYNISSNYEIMDGIGRIAFSLVDLNNTPKYQVVIDYNTHKAYFITSTNVTAADITSNTTVHLFRIQITKTNTTIIIDSQTFTIQTPKDYTHGFMQLETIDTYAEFTNFVIEKRGAKMPVAIRIADSQYTQYKTDKTNTTIKTNNSINLTNYNVKATFRTLSNNMITLQLRNTTTITYIKDSNTLTINDSNITESYRVDAPKTLNDITAKITNKSINIYYNGEFVTTIDNNDTTLVPSISYTNVTVSDFYIKANDAPITISYDISAPKESTAGLLTVDALKYFKDTTSSDNTTNLTLPSIGNITAGLSEDERSSLEDYYERTKTTYDNYRITATYVDRSRTNTLNLAMAGINGTIYSVAVDDNNKTVTIRYLENSTLQKYNFSIDTASVNRLIIDVKNSTLFVTLNSRTVFNKHVERYNDGVILFDYKNITILNAQIEDRSTGSITVFQRQLNINCDPILTNKYLYTGNITIADKDMEIVKSQSRFNSTFDIAKVQVTLDNGQEIHYWTKLI